MNFIHWIHHFFNPHCVECKDEFTENKLCQSCETLKIQLTIANAEKQRMLDALLDKPKPVELGDHKLQDPQQLKPRMVTWNVRKQMLEAEDREKARILKSKADEEKKFKDSMEDIEKLEKELGVEDAQAKQ